MQWDHAVASETDDGNVQQAPAADIGVINMVNRRSFSIGSGEAWSDPAIDRAGVSVDDQPDITAIDRIYDLHRHGQHCAHSILRNRSAQRPAASGFLSATAAICASLH